MAFLDSADLLQRWLRTINRPTTAEAPDPDPTLADTGYALLTEAQAHWQSELAAHVPDMAGLYSLEKLTSSDGGVSYDFTSDPLGHYELRETKNGRLLIPGADWDLGADFVPYGKKIRFPGQKVKVFGDGPWARYVRQPGILDANTQPTLQPVNARILLVYHAAGLWASRGGQQDPSPYWALEAKAAFGNPQTGEVGIIGSLKQQVFLSGAAAVDSGSAPWYG